MALSLHLPSTSCHVCVLLHKTAFGSFSRCFIDLLLVLRDTKSLKRASRPHLQWSYGIPDCCLMVGVGTMAPHFAMFLTVFLAVGSLAAVRGLAVLSVQPALQVMLPAIACRLCPYCLHLCLAHSFIDTM